MQLSGPRLKAQRIAAGLNRERVALAVSRSAGTIALWEAGRVTPSGTQLAELANLYGCSPAAFFVRSEVAA